MVDNFRPIIEDMDNKQFEDLLFEIRGIENEVIKAREGNFGSKQYLEERFDIITRVLEFDD